MLTTACENYLKCIYMLHARSPQRPLVPMGDVASALNVAPGTATAMVKRLARDRLVAYEPYAGARLTRKGEAAALAILRRHRLVEALLVEVLGLDWSEVHDEAERLEHAISDKLLDRIDALLGFPTVDPHGDPIPSASGVMERPRLASLLQSPLAVPLRVARILDQREDFLRFIDQKRLRPGGTATILSREPAADSLTLKTPGEEPFSLGNAAAAKILVESGTSG